MSDRQSPRFLDCKDMTIEEAQVWGETLAERQRDVMFQIGDLARYAEARWQDSAYQVFPEWVSPGLIQRTAGVAKAYPRIEDRQVEATYSQYLQNASKPDRMQRLQKIVEDGLTTDESRKADAEERKAKESAQVDRPRWILAVDVNYFLHRYWFSGAGVEAASSLATWIQRTAERLKEKGLTDCVCCFDSKVNHRKEFTKDWEHKYKGNRGEKDPELVQQLNLVQELIKNSGLSCVQIEGMEADDVMASVAKQFPGKVTLLTQDKDCRQCLSEKCNMLLDVEWSSDETTGDAVAEYKWMSAKLHTETTGIPPDKWIDMQMIMGDAADGIKGAIGIGEKGAADLVKMFGTVEAAIEAAKKGDERIKPKPRNALVEFEAKLEVTRKLVTLRTDLEIPASTRI